MADNISRLSLNIPSEYILSFQYSSVHEATPNTSADWKNAPRVNPDSGINIPTMNCDCTHCTSGSSYQYGALWDAVGQWATIFKVEGTELVENVGVELTDFKLWRYNEDRSEWILLNEGFDYGAFYLEDFWDDGNAPLPNNKILSDDKKTYKCLMNADTAGRCFHPFSPQISFSELGFNTNPCYLFTQVKCRLIVWNEAGLDNRLSANLCANVGGDYWIYKGATFDSQWRHNKDWSLGQFIKITNNWRYAYATNCPQDWDKGFPN